MHLAETSLIGVYPIAVVDFQDVSYLQMIKDILLSKGKLNTFYDVLVFAGGDNGIDANAEIFSVGGEPPAVLLASDEQGHAIKARLLSTTYKHCKHKVFEISDFVSGAVQFEDLMPPQFIEKFLGDYFDKLLDVNFKFVGGLRLSLTEQIEEYAKRNNITLPPKYRAKMAKEMKLRVRDMYVDNKIPGSYGKMWLKMMKALLGD